MSPTPVKTKALILNVLAYRESSVILYLLTEKLGLVHGVAKGIKSCKKGSLFLERGFVIELLIYNRPHRDLHTVGGIQVEAAFPQTRVSLIKSTVRDAAFEVLLSGVVRNTPAPELFDIIIGFCTKLEVDIPDSAPADTARPLQLLWRFYLELCNEMGFSLALDNCYRCGNQFGDIDHGYLFIAEGAVCCVNCTDHSQQVHFLPPGAVDCNGYLVDLHDARRITRTLATFCRYHMDTKYQYRAVEFLMELLGEGESR